MFESIIFRHQRKADASNPLDPGLLAEALLFYQSVTVIADQGMLRQLINECGCDILLDFIENGYLRIAYLDNHVGIRTHNANTPHERHDPIVFSAPKQALDIVAPQLFVDATGKSGKGRRMASRFLRNVDVVSFETGLTEDVLVDFSDSGFVEQSVVHIIKHYTPEYPNPDQITFRLHRDGGSLLVQTNMDFRTLNDIYHTRIPPSHSRLSPAYLLSHLFNVRSDIYFCSRYETEIATDPVNSRVFNLKYVDLLQRRQLSEDALRLFQNFVFDDAKAVGAVIKSGARSWKDLLELLRKAKKFQGWLKDKDPEGELLKEYYKEVTSDSWVDKLPAKGARWTLFTGIGLGIDALGAGGLGTASGIAISAADAFILDSVIRGWKPNQFVEKELREFVEGTE